MIKIVSDVKEKILKCIQDGNHVLIFPEGTVHHDGIPKSFKNGIFHLCHDNNIPILPVTIKSENIGLEREDTFSLYGILDINPDVMFILLLSNQNRWKVKRQNIQRNYFTI